MSKNWHSTVVVGVMVLLAAGSVDTQNNGAGNSPPSRSTSTSTRVDGGPQSAVETNQPPKKPTNLIVDNAADVMYAYESNEVAADAEMKNKRFAVRGKIDSIGKDILNTPYVVLKGDKFAIFGVQCMFSTQDEPALARLSKGSQVTIAGVCSGKLGSVIMRDCWIYDEFASEREKQAIAAENKRKAEEQKRVADLERTQKIDAAKWRKWTSKDGGFSIEAKFVSYAIGKITMERRDGKRIQVELSKLSDDDRKWVDSQEWLKAAN